MNRNTKAFLALILLAVLFIGVNITSNNLLRAQRVDLTEERLFTLSAASKKIIAGIDEPITLKLFFSEAMATTIPSLRTYGQRVRELLEEYVTRSNGKLRLEVIDPRPFSDEEDEATRSGIQPVPIGTGRNFFFGLVGVNTTDDKKIIPFFQQEKEAFLEYEMTRLIYNLTDPDRAKVALITGHGMRANLSPMMRLNPRAPQPWAIVEQIRNSFDMDVLDPNFEKIDKDVDVLLIIHPYKLTDKARYAIDQYVLGGGKAMVMLDPMSEVAASEARGKRGGGDKASSALPELLKAWGVEIRAEKVVGDWSVSQEVNAGLYGRVDVVRYLPWLKLSGERLNRNDVITSTLGDIIMPSAGAIMALKGATTKIAPLITSTKNSMLIDVVRVKFGPDPKGLLKAFKADENRYVLAARIHGPAVTAFPKGPPVEKAAKGSPKTPAAKLPKSHLAKSKKPINVILVADGDMVFDQFWARPQNMMGQRLLVEISSNGSFVINALDNLVGSSDLINLRGRGRSSRPFVVVEQLRRAAELKFLNQEQELRESLEAAMTKIGELQSKAKTEGGALLSQRQRETISEARREVRKTRKELRSVQLNLNRDIEVLAARLKFANIALMPILLTMLALVMAVIGYGRRRRAMAAVRH